MLLRFHRTKSNGLWQGLTSVFASALHFAQSTQNQNRQLMSLSKTKFFSLSFVVCTLTSTILYILLRFHSFILYYHGKTQSHRWPKSGRINRQAEEPQKRPQCCPISCGWTCRVERSNLYSNTFLKWQARLRRFKHLKTVLNYYINFGLSSMSSYIPIYWNIVAMILTDISPLYL